MWIHISTDGSVDRKVPPMPSPSPRFVGTPTIVGTNNDDFIQGTGCKDYIIGLGGNDKILDKVGNDAICGGDGDDELLRRQRF
jgi:Ca2+-binding RTX toxin-like protein